MKSKVNLTDEIATRLISICKGDFAGRREALYVYLVQKTGDKLLMPQEVFDWLLKSVWYYYDLSKEEQVQIILNLLRCGDKLEYLIHKVEELSNETKQF